jgi:hypothetical protein
MLKNSISMEGKLNKLKKGLKRPESPCSTASA